MDPYVVLKVKDSLGLKVGNAWRSRVVPGDHDPIWNEHTVFEALEVPRGYDLRMLLFDKEEFLGWAGELPLTPFEAFSSLVGQDGAGKDRDLNVLDIRLGFVDIDLGKLRKTKDWQEVKVFLKNGAVIELALNTMGGWGEDSLKEEGQDDEVHVIEVREKETDLDGTLLSKKMRSGRGLCCGCGKSIKAESRTDKNMAV